MRISATKDSFGPDNLQPCIRISFLSKEHEVDPLLFDWDLWCEFCNKEAKIFTDWIVFAKDISGEIVGVDHEESLLRCSVFVIFDFLLWLK